MSLRSGGLVADGASGVAVKVTVDPAATICDVGENR
jgi:hypothetical protein